MLRLLILAIDQAGGHVAIPPDAALAMPPTAQLRQRTDPDGTVHLEVVKPKAVPQSKGAVERATKAVAAERDLGLAIPEELRKALGTDLTHLADTPAARELVRTYEVPKDPPPTPADRPRVGIVGPVSLGRLERFTEELAAAHRDELLAPHQGLTADQLTVMRRLYAYNPTGSSSMATSEHGNALTLPRATVSELEDLGLVRCHWDDVPDGSAYLSPEGVDFMRKRVDDLADLQDYTGDWC